MTITKALRKLYKVIVGEEAPANANTITKVLRADSADGALYFTYTGEN